LNSETRYATARQFVLKETFIYKLQPYENTVNYKRKSRRRFFLLERSSSPPISSEFRGGGGFEHPKPPPSVRHCKAPPHVHDTRCFRAAWTLTGAPPCSGVWPFEITYLIAIVSTFHNYYRRIRTRTCD